MKRRIRKVKQFVERKMAEMKHFMVDSNGGMGTVEIILIIVVLIGLVILFKSQITEVVKDIFDKITSQTKQI